MRRIHRLYSSAIARLLTLLLCAVMAVALVPGLSGRAYAAEVKGQRLLIQVKGENGYRVPWLEIYYLPPYTPAGVEPQLLGTTDARGEVVFTQLENGEFQFFYSVPSEQGRVRVPYTIEDFNGRHTMTIDDPRLKGEKDGEVAENTTLKLDIVGYQVVDAKGDPLPNAKLAFWKCPSSRCTDSRAEGHSRVFTTITDREGNCAYSGIDTGRYHVEATVYDSWHRKLFSETMALDVAVEDEKKSRTITLTTAKAAEAAKPGSGVLTLAFADAKGKPVTDVRVGYREPGAKEDYWLGCTDGKGEISLAKVKKGTYTFFYYTEQDNNKKDNRKDFTCEVKDPAVSKTVPVKAIAYGYDKYISPLDMGSKPPVEPDYAGAWSTPSIGLAAPIVDGIIPKAVITVLDQYKKPVAGAKCVIASRCASKKGLEKEDLHYKAEAYTDSEGKAVFKNFHAGDWTISLYRTDRFQRERIVGCTGNHFSSNTKEEKYTVYADEPWNLVNADNDKWNRK